MTAARRRRGFANPEYLLTLAALGIILAVVVPAVAKARERRRNAQALQSLRAAVAAYAADMKTKGPLQLSELTKDGKYLKALPSFGLLGRHQPSSEVKELGVLDDSGGWTYWNWPGSPEEGKVVVNCTHTDSSGRSWASY